MQKAVNLSQISEAFTCNAMFINQLISRGVGILLGAFSEYRT